MTFTVGRASFTNAPRAVSHDGDVLSFNIDILPSSLTEAKVLRQQVLGLANNADEPVVPVTWSDDSDYDGFYVVLSASCEPTSAYLTNKLMRCVLALQRVSGGFARPLVEVAFTFAELSNPHSVTERGRIAVPNTGRELESATLSTVQFQTTATGEVVLVRATSLPASGTLNYQVGPGDFYDGASTIEYQVDGTWYVLAGQQIPAAATSWRISNGWLRMTPSEVTTGEWAMVFEGYASSTYNTFLTLERGTFNTVWLRDEFATVNPYALSTPSSNVLAFPIVLRNSPERVVIKVPQYRGYETWSLSRGDAYVQGYYTTSSGTAQMGVTSRSAVAVTDSTSHMVRTTADGAGFKFFVSMPYANTVDTTNGRIYTDASRSDLAFAAGFSTPVSFTGQDEWQFAMTAHAIAQRISSR